MNIIGGIVSEIVLYSGDENEYDIYKEKESIFKKLAEFVDITLYEVVELEDEIRLSLKKGILGDNLKIFLETMKQYLVDGIVEYKNLQENYYEEDRIQNEISKLSTHLGIDIKYIEFWKPNITISNNGDLLIKSFKNLAKGLSANYLCRAITFFCKGDD